MPIKVLVCPLNWGLGHATRCIPIIKQLIDRQCEVLIAADGRAASLLQREFPQLQHLHLSGYDVQFPNSQQPLSLHIGKQLPKIFYRIWQEHRQLQQIVRQHQIKCVISDNRYGCWSPQCRSVFLTHQLFIRLPHQILFLQTILWQLNRWFLSRYAQVWIPDQADPQNNLSGELSHSQTPLPRYYRYIGILSRFEPPRLPLASWKYDLLILLSGTEPQRTELESILLAQLSTLPQTSRILFVRGITESRRQHDSSPNICLVDHMTTDALRQALLESRLIITRSGYTSLMDLVQLQKSAILIPTPQQTEQLYLAEYLEKQGLFCSVSQNNLDIVAAIQQYRPQTVRSSLSPTLSLLTTAIDNLLEQIPQQ